MIPINLIRLKFYKIEKLVILLVHKNFIFVVGNFAVSKNGKVN